MLDWQTVTDQQIYSVTFNANFVIITPLCSFFTMVKELRSSVIIMKFALRVTE